MGNTQSCPKSPLCRALLCIGSAPPAQDDGEWFDRRGGGRRKKRSRSKTSSASKMPPMPVVPEVSAPTLTIWFIDDGISHICTFLMLSTLHRRVLLAATQLKRMRKVALHSSHLRVVAMLLNQMPPSHFPRSNHHPLWTASVLMSPPNARA